MKPDQFINEGSNTVTLCGSTKFFKECMEVNKILTFKLWLVYMCGSWGHSYHKNDPVLPVNHDVKRLHYSKILRSSLVVVVSDDSEYYGESTEDEILFSYHVGIPVVYWTPKKGFYGDDIDSPVPNIYQTNLLKKSILENWFKRDKNKLRITVPENRTVSIGDNLKIGKDHFSVTDISQVFLGRLNHHFIKEVFLVKKE